MSPSLSQSTFFVRDNGMGIAPEHFERIFGLFNKLDPRSEGRVLALPWSKRIVEVHGGRIWVESEAGHGTTFFFTLPHTASCLIPLYNTVISLVEDY